MKEQQKRHILYGVAAALVAALIFYIGYGETPAPQDAAPSPQTATSSGDSDTSQVAKPAFDLVRISRGGTGVIAGRMTPGAEVELFANGRKISSVVADENGEWVMILDEPLEAGSVELNLKSYDANADQAREAEDVVVVSVPERESERFVERSDSGVIAVLSPKSGNGASRVLQKPGGTVFSEVGDSLRFDTVDYGGGQTVITGRGLPRVEVRLYLNDTFKGAAKVMDDGRWSISFAGDLGPGENRLRLDQTLTGGDVQLRIEQPVVAGEALDTTVAESGVIVQPGNTLWQIARRLYGSGVRYTVIFRENSEQIRDPDLIYPGQVFRLPGDTSTSR